MKSCCVKKIDHSTTSRCGRGIVRSCKAFFLCFHVARICRNHFARATRWSWSIMWCLFFKRAKCGRRTFRRNTFLRSRSLRASRASAWTLVKWHVDHRWFSLTWFNIPPAIVEVKDSRWNDKIIWSQKVDLKPSDAYRDHWFFIITTGARSPKMTPSPPATWPLCHRCFLADIFCDKFSDNFLL